MPAIAATSMPVAFEDGGTLGVDDRPRGAVRSDSLGQALRGASHGRDLREGRTRAIHAIVLAAILAAIVWTYRDQLRALVGPEP